jgi:hypothetical protein
MSADGRTATILRNYYHGKNYQILNQHKLLTEPHPRPNQQHYACAADLAVRLTAARRARHKAGRALADRPRQPDRRTCQSKPTERPHRLASQFP